MDNIIKLLAGFEEIAYKILMLVIIIPKTLLKIIFDPVGARKYVEEQLELIEKNKTLAENQRVATFAEYFSPVLLLLALALVPALLLAFLPPTGVTITSSAIPNSSTQYDFTGQAVFSSSAQGKGYQFKWEVLEPQNQNQPLVAAEIHMDTNAGKGGIKYDDTKASDTYFYDFKREGNYRVRVSVIDQYGEVLFTDTKSVSVTPDSKDPKNLKASVPNSEIVSDIKQKDLTLQSFSDVLEKDTTIFLAFALLLPPLFFAFVYSLATHRQLTEQDMRKIFYVECYYFSPLGAAIWAFYYSLFFLTGGAFQLTVSIWNFAPPILALIWFVSVETNALADESEEDNITRFNAFFIVVACIVAVTVIGLVISVSIADATVRDTVREIVIWIYLLISFGLIGIYFVNRRKARKQAIAEKKTVAKDEKAPTSPRLKWIAWSSLSIVLLCFVVTIAISTMSQSLLTSSGSTPAAATESSNDKLPDNANWTVSVVGGDPSEASIPNYENGGVRLTLQPKQNEYPSAYYIYNTEYSDIQIVTSAKSNNDSPHSVSLVCRHNELGWYEFEVADSGDYYIYRINLTNNNADYTVLTSGSSPLVDVGNENTYAAECSGSNLSLSINNNIVGTVKDTDNEFAHGQVGVAVYSPESKEVDVQFAYVTIAESRSQSNLANIGAMGATATPTPAPSNALAGDFANQWDEYSDQEIKPDPANNTLPIQLAEKDGQIPSAYFIYNFSSYSDVQMRVVVANNGDDSDGIDLICRLNDNGWYDFEVSSNGSYEIYAYESTGDNYTTLTSGDSPEIRTGKDSNTYTAKCEGSELTLLVNGKAVATVQETTFNYAEGLVGFGVFSWDNSPVDVSVNSVTISGAALQPSNPNVGTATSVPDTNVSPTGTPASQAQRFFTEEFDTSDAIGNWPYFVVDGDTYRIGQGAAQGLSISSGNGALTFDLEAMNLWVYTTYDPFEYDNVRIDMQATNRGANTNNVSLICRYTNTGWYEFNVSNGGIYNIYYAKVDSNDKVSYEPLAEGGSAAVKYGHDTNDYTAICDGNTLSLYINGQKIRDVAETKYNLISGKVGVSVSSFDILPVTIDVDSVTISQP